MIDLLCDTQLLLAQAVRLAAQQGDSEHVNELMRCWFILNRRIQRIA